MAQLNAYLKLEAEGFAPTRGFTPDSRVQTYEVHLARKVREKYDAAFLGVLEGAQRSRGQQRGGGGGRAGGGGGGGGGASSRTKGFRASPEEGIHRQRELNQYLMTYLGTPQPSVTGASGTSGAAAGAICMCMICMGAICMCMCTGAICMCMCTGAICMCMCTCMCMCHVHERRGRR